VKRHDENLEAWRLSHELAVAVTKAVRRFPLDDRIALGGQLRRAAVSVPANLVEGKATPGVAWWLKYAGIARASVLEVDCLLRVARDAGIMEPADYQHLADLAWRTHGMIFQLIVALRKRADHRP